MEHWINLTWPVDRLQLEKIYNFFEVRGDNIIYHFRIVGFDLTNCAIRGEVYDLNVSNRLANDLGGAQSAPEIIINDTGAVSGVAQFTATVGQGLTAMMQTFGQVEFKITQPSGAQFTILQQAIQFQFQRIIWTTEKQAIQEGEGAGTDPLF